MGPAPNTVPVLLWTKEVLGTRGKEGAATGPRWLGSRVVPLAGARAAGLCGGFPPSPSKYWGCSDSPVDFVGLIRLIVLPDVFRAKRHSFDLCS